MQKLTLETKLDQEIEKMWFDAGKMLHQKEFSNSKELMLSAWSKLPEPRESYSHSYWISRYLTEASIGLRNFEFADKWLTIHKKTGLFRVDSGEKDFLEGKLYYAKEEMEKAKHCFEIANKKSEGRLFKNEQANIYKELLSKDSIRPTELNRIIEASLIEIQKQNYPYALSLLYDALNIDHANSIVHFNKGICHYELEELEQAADSFTQAYMLDGQEIFKSEDPKYIEYLKSIIEIK